MKALLISIAMFYSFLMQSAVCAEEVSSMAQYEAAISSGKIVKMHPNLKMKFGHAIQGTLITFRERDENDYSSVLVYGANHLTIKNSKSDQAARYRVDAVFNIAVGSNACIVFIESEGVGINGPGAGTDLASHRGLVFCQSANHSKIDEALTAKLENESGEHGIQSASQVRKILKEYIKH